MCYPLVEGFISSAMNSASYVRCYTVFTSPFNHVTSKFSFLLVLKLLHTISHFPLAQQVVMDCLASHCLTVATRLRTRVHHDRDVKRRLPNLCGDYTHCCVQDVYFLSPCSTFMGNKLPDIADTAFTCYGKK